MRVDTRSGNSWSRFQTIPLVAASQIYTYIKEQNYFNIPTIVTCWPLAVLIKSFTYFLLLRLDESISES